MSAIVTSVCLLELRIMVPHLIQTLLLEGRGNSRGLTPTLNMHILKLPREVSKTEPTKEVREEQQ